MELFHVNIIPTVLYYTYSQLCVLYLLTVFIICFGLSYHSQFSVKINVKSILLSKSSDVFRCRKLLTSLVTRIIKTLKFRLLPLYHLPLSAESHPYVPPMTASSPAQFSFVSSQYASSEAGGEDTADAQSVLSHISSQIKDKEQARSVKY